MSTAVKAFLDDTHQAITIWVSLLVVIAAAFVLYSVSSRRKEITAFKQRIAIRRVSLTAQATQLRRTADEMQVAAVSAGATAERRHEEWHASQRAVEAAWQAYDQADRAATETSRAMAFSAAPETLTAEELASRERYLRRVTAEAYHRGALSIDQLVDASMHRNGWDPAMHPADLDARLCQLARTRLHQVYRSAVAVERAAWRDAAVAAAARQSLAEEALTAENAAKEIELELVSLAKRRFGEEARAVAKAMALVEAAAANERTAATTVAVEPMSNVRELRPVRVREVLVGPASATVQMPRVAA